MRVLAFDTTSGACSVAVFENGGVLAHRRRDLSRGHAELLLPMIDSVLAEAATRYGALDILAVTIGPGTFTGIRVGLAAARGIALTMGVPIAGVNTLAAVAEGARSSASIDAEQAVLVLHDARRGELYAQLFPPSAETLDASPAIIPVTDALSVAPAGPGAVVGSGAELVRDEVTQTRPDLQFPDVPQDPDAIHVARIGERMMESGIVGASSPEPLYLRAPDARLPDILVHRPG